MEKAILAVSFGSSVEQTRQREIIAVEQAISAAAGGTPLYTAYTSPTIRRILAKRGVIVPDVRQALEQLAEQGIREVYIQPTHLLYGYEYEKLQDTARQMQGQFQLLRLGSPLIAGTEALLELTAILGERFPQEPGQRVVLLGHGTGHFANFVYPAMQAVFHMAGREDVLIGTIEGWPGFDQVQRQLMAGEAKKVVLAPLLLTAGEHAREDMAGENPASWMMRLCALGFSVQPVIEGLGANKKVQAMYAAHLGRLLEGEDQK